MLRGAPILLLSSFLLFSCDSPGPMEPEPPEKFTLTGTFRAVSMNGQPFPQPVVAGSRCEYTERWVELRDTATSPSIEVHVRYNSPQLCGTTHRHGRGRYETTRDSLYITISPFPGAINLHSMGDAEWIVFDESFREHRKFGEEAIFIFERVD